MKKLLTGLCALFICMAHSLGQSVDYTIPQGFEDKVTKDEYKKIIDISVDAVSKRFTIDRVLGGAIFLKEGQDLQGFNLQNLVLRCAMLKDKVLIESEVRGYFDNIFKSIDAQKKVNPKDFESIKDYLTIRVYPIPYLEARGDTSKLVMRNDLEETRSLLMLDLPGAFIPVEKENLSTWKKDKTEVFGIAQNNINKQVVEKKRDTVDVDGIKIELFFISEDDYAGSYGLGIGSNSPEFVGEWGTALAIPHRGTVLGCKISKDKPLDFVKFIQITKEAVEDRYAQHPQRISNRFFWYYKGKFTPITVITEKDGKINVISPQGLTVLMTK
jgi:uncharacterized protein YtpQ (UPF0354 family)